MLVSCLTVTNRPEWLPWVEYQVSKQQSPRAQVEHLIDDGGGTVGEKRTRLLARAQGDLIAWFDDDDWSHPCRLQTGVYYLRDTESLACVGNWRSRFVSLRDIVMALPQVRCREHQSHEGVIFNGAVYRTAIVPTSFEPISQREDTFWQQQLHTRQRNFMVYERDLMHFWLSHKKNVTNGESQVDFNSIITDLPLDKNEQKILREVWES